MQGKVDFNKTNAKAGKIAEQLNVEIGVPKLMSRSCSRSNTRARDDVEFHLRSNVFHPAVDAGMRDFELQLENHQTKAINISLLHSQAARQKLHAPSWRKI